MTNQTTENRKKIAILGGGMASIAAAFELSATPELRDQYEVTIYQLGWRLGGKGASGRDMQRQARSLEHGMHTWFGFYENAFCIMRDCYDKLNRAPNAPLATWQDAFKPDSWWVFHENYKGRWIGWPIQFPTNSSTPGDGKLWPTFLDMIQEFLQVIREIWNDLHHDKQLLSEIASKTPVETKPDWWQDMIAQVGELETFDHQTGLKLLEQALSLAKAGSDLPEKETANLLHGRICKKLTLFKKALWYFYVKSHLDNDKLRVFFMVLDLGSAMLCGIINDQLLERGFTSVDDEELSAWLERHGARKYPTIDSFLVQAVYDLILAYVDGDTSKPNYAAGTAVKAILRLVLSYKGAINWKMQAGMGETIFAPFYELLRRRGDSSGNRSVNFKFFHCITNLGISDDDASIDRIEVIPQVSLTVEEYDPLILVKGLPCWANEPRWDQLQNGEKLRQQGINFEHDPNPLQVKPITLYKGIDFDEIILGISIAALPKICKEILQHHHKEKWQNMFDHVKTVMTQAFQVWCNRDLNGLGWDYNPNAMSMTYTEPLSTLWNQNQLIEQENWPSKYQLQNIAYVCGVLPNQDSQEDATAEAKKMALNYLKKHIKTLWPNATQKNSDELNWNLLIDPQERRGEARFDAQYWRGNWQPTERYVQSVSGSTKYRLKTDESGYDNLYLAGDWIKTGLDVGCIEAATMAGMQASRAICGYPQKIIGEQMPWGD